MEKVNSLLLKKPEGRRFAISDIHGCARTFKALLKCINLKKEDHLYILGDSVSRGPNSAKVLDIVLKLLRKGRQVYFLKGNHEDILLRANQKGPDALFKVLKNSKNDALAHNGRLKDSYRILLEEAFHYLELPDFYLVHAGFDFSGKSPFEDSHSMMYIKEFKPNKVLLENKRVILGHSPKNLPEIVSRLKSDRRKIHIDNGCINTKAQNQGNLICLNLDSLGLIVQPNIEK